MTHVKNCKEDYPVTDFSKCCMKDFSVQITTNMCSITILYNSTYFFILIEITPFKEVPMYFMETRKLAGEGNGNPLQYYCLENPMEGGAW